MILRRRPDALTGVAPLSKAIAMQTATRAAKESALLATSQVPTQPSLRGGFMDSVVDTSDIARAKPPGHSIAI